MRHAATPSAATMSRIDRVALESGCRSRSRFSRSFRLGYRVDLSKYRARLRNYTASRIQCSASMATSSQVYFPLSKVS
jgi:transcriptional regulator GlxA family with amidase domain